MRLDGLLVVGVFFGSVMEKSSNWTDLSNTYILVGSTRVDQGRRIREKFHFDNSFMIIV